MLEKVMARRQQRNIEKREVVTTPDGSTVETDGSAWSTLVDIFNQVDPTTLTKSNATNFNTIYSCVNVLSDDIAKLPWKTYKKTKGIINRKTDHPLDYLLTHRPNEYQTPFAFKKSLMVDVLTRGNAYALIEYDKEGFPKSLLPLGESVTRFVIDSKTGKSFYRTSYRDKNLDLQPYEVFHIRGLGNGLVGQSPIEVLRTQVEANKSADLHNKTLIEGGGVPKGILRVQQAINKDAKDVVRNEWVRANSNQAIAIIDNGLEYQQMGISQVDMAFIESKKLNQQEIAAIFKVPLHKINQLDNATFSNIEHQSLDYVKNTLQPWIVQLEEEANYKFFSQKEGKNGYYTKFNIDSELRGDAETRAKVQEIKLRNGFISVNEGRAQDEQSPFDIELANEPLITLNYTPLSRLEEYQYSGLTHLNQSNQTSKDPPEDDSTDKGGENE